MAKAVAKKKPHPVDVHVGERLRMRRQILGLAQVKLGELLGITFQQVQKYEKGTNRIGASRLWRISQILQVPVGYFFEGLDSSNDGLPASGRKEDRDLVRFWNSKIGVELGRLLLKFNTDHLKALADFLRTWQK